MVQSWRANWRFSRTAVIGLVLALVSVVLAVLASENPEDKCKVTIELVREEGRSGEVSPAGRLNVSLTRVDGNEPSAVRALSTADGVVVLDLSAGKWRAVVRPEPTRAYWGDLSLVVPNDKPELEAQMQVRKAEAVDLEGVLLDYQSGAPIAGAKISAQEEGCKRLQARAVTDDRGRFTLAGLWSHASYELAARASEVEGVQTRTVGPSDLVSGQLVWRASAPPPARSVHVRVFVQRDGESVPFTREVIGLADDEKAFTELRCVSLTRDPDTGHCSGWDSCIARVDNAGECTIEGLSPGEYLIQGLRVNIVKPGGKRGEPKQLHPVGGDMLLTVPDDADADLSFDLVVGSEPLQMALSGIVAASDGGGPVEKASVKASILAFDGDMVAAGQRETDAAGAFELAVQPSVCELVVKKPGFARSRTVVFAVPGAQIEIQLEQERAVGGIVTDPEDRPVKAEICVHRAGSGQPVPATITDKEGRFVFRSIRSRDQRLVIRAKGFPARIVEVDPDADASNLRIKLDPGIAVTGHVRFDGPEKPAGALGLAFVDPALGIEEAVVPLAPDGEYKAVVNRGKRLVVYLEHDLRESYELGELDPASDAVTKDFAVTADILASPAERHR